MTGTADPSADGILAVKGDAAPLCRPPPEAPLRADHASPPQRYAAALRPARRADRVLVLATDRFNARLYRDLLEAAGYRAAVPKGADRWIEALRDWRPDLILIDPGAIAGPALDAGRTILRDPDLRTAPVIAVIDASDPGGAATLLGGCAGRIVKPVSLPGFFAPIEAALAHHPRSAAGGWARTA